MNKTTYSVLLASGSPRRRELIADLNVPYIYCSPDADETLPEGVEPEEIPAIIAARKARAARDLPESEGRVIISADTIVVLDGKIYGKPADAAEAKLMLSELSGRTHCVTTGVCIVLPDGRTVSFSETTPVTFFPLSDREIEQYVATGEPLDKAGAYGIQAQGKMLIKCINGDFYNVMGLPIARLRRTLDSLFAIV